MNRKVTVFAVIFYVYLLIDNIQNGLLWLSVFNVIGMLTLIIAFIWDVKYRDEDQVIEKRQGPYINFAFLYFILGKQIENLLTYIHTGYNLGIILYTEGILAFGFLTIFEFINFFRYRKWNIKWVYYTLIGIEIAKLLFFICLTFFDFA